MAVRWWKVAVRGKVVKEEGAGWNGGGVSAGDWVGDGEEGVRVMEPIEEYEDAEEEEEMECDAVDEEDEGDDDDEEEDGQMEL